MGTSRSTTTTLLIVRDTTNVLDAMARQTIGGILTMPVGAPI